MKRFFAIFFTCIYLFAYTEARQLLKLPALVEHYITHVEKNPKTTVYSFFKMHYLDAPVKDSDYQQDMKLPFKTHDLSALNFGQFQSPPKVYDINFDVEFFTEIVEKSFIYKDSHTVHQLHSIFRPPILV